MKKLACILLLFAWLIDFTSAQTKYEPTWESIDKRPIPRWYTDAKFGIFIHWGVYSVPAWGPLPKDGAGIYDCYAEHYWQRLMNEKSAVHKLFADFHAKNYGTATYQDFVHDFKCEMFNPDAWAELFKKAGAKYVVLTSKHHEGFALWPSQHSWNWNSMDVGPHRDLAGDLTTAVKAAGLHMGFYYSLLEWFNPLYKEDIDKYVDEHMIPQMKDLVTRYKPDIIWPDGEWIYPSEQWKSTSFLAWLYNESPVKETVVVNDRWGKETRSKHGGFYTTEYDLVHDNNGINIKAYHPWEECRGIGNSFGYNRNENIEDYSTSEALIHLLIGKVSMGGNLLLNIGPTADGRIPVIMQQRLIDMGNWLQVNGEAIYGTTMWPVATKHSDPSVYFTVKGKDLYVICTKYPDKEITIKGIAQGPTTVSLLGSDALIRYARGKSVIIINPPVLSPNQIPCDHAWVFKLSGCL